MPHTTDADVDIYYDVTGDPSAPPVVLIAGTGAQLIAWHTDLVALLVAEGLRVVRIDNRDTGQSQRFGGPEDLDGGYEMADLAADVVRVLDDLGAPAGHVVGHSMGGIVAQLAALDFPDRVLSLGLLGTLPGTDPRYVLHPRPTIAAPPRLSRDEAIELGELFARADGPGFYDQQVAWHRDRAAEAYDRGYAPEGVVRQWSAMLRAPERLDRLAELSIPTLVFHGRLDGSVHWSAAVDIAGAITDAELQIHPRMGHLVPHELWPDLVAGISRAARRAATAGRAL